MAEKIIETMDYGSLVDLFVKSGLEIHPDDPVPDGLLTCFRLEDEITGERYGAAGLCFDAEEYILRCVAVEEAQRGRGYGIRLVDAVMKKAEEMGAVRIWLTAKVPEFYPKVWLSDRKKRRCAISGKMYRVSTISQWLRLRSNGV